MRTTSIAWLLPLVFMMSACGEPPQETGMTATIDDGRSERLLPAGAWRGVIEIQGQQLPFRMDVSYPAEQPTPEVVFINGEERVPVGEVHVAEDSVALVMPVFNTRIDARMRAGKLAGVLTKVTRGGAEQKMAVVLTPGPEYRFFPPLESAEVNVAGRWSVMFREEDGGNYPAIAELRQQGNQVFGTFLTPTSDHRYLAGGVRNGRLHLSAWDGYHVFLFEADIREDGSLHGDFWSGTSSHETWIAKRDPDARLPDMDKRTSLEPGVERFSFTFPDLDGKPVSLDDSRFGGKPVIVQLAASWCPNCADQARFLAPWYNVNRERGIEVVALMFEHFDDVERAAAQVRHWREAWGVEYPTLIAGISDKQDASSRLPQLDAVLAFPTTLFIRADGRVARIQTGFNGPATGRYDADIAAFNATVDAMLEVAR